MQEKPDINIIVSNVLREKCYSHCRLCLKFIKEEYVLFDDPVSLDIFGDTFQPLSEVLTKLLGKNICDKITGIEAVCTDCVTAALTSLRFIEKCQKSSYVINTVIQKLSDTLNADISIKGKDKNLYIVINDLESGVLLVDKPQKRRKHISKRSFECAICIEYFECFADFKLHNFSVHSSTSCDKCMETFESNSDYEAHESDTHKYHRYKCSYCPQYISTKEKLNVHYKKIHSVYNCKECSKPCRGLKKLRRHEEIHKPKDICPKCGKAYLTAEFYEKHVKLCIKNLIDPHPTRNDMEKSFPCEKCDKAYSTSGGLRVHKRFAHGNANPHVCKVCGKKFTAPSYLKVHMTKHTGEKNFKCKLCNRKFVSKEALLYHTRRHTGEKPYTCKFCDEKYVNASARAEHIKFKHVGPTLMCEICSRKFVTINCLKHHIKKHHDPTSKLYYGRNMIPPNLPMEQNMRRFIETEN